MKKILNRRAFIVGCVLLTFSSAGVFLTGCNDRGYRHRRDDDDRGYRHERDDDERDDDY